jgi:DNA-binding GntR family transcriptional regulator
MDKALPAVRYRTATEHAFRMLKQWIIQGDIAPGTPIDQSEVSARLGMSRMPVRTALERLDSEGLIMLMPHRGAVVAPTSVREMHDLYFVRHHLEGIATELAAETLAEAELEAIARILDTIEAQVRSGDLEAFLASNRAFHMAVYRAAHNVVLEHVIASLWDLSERYRRAYLQLPARARESTAEHRQIYELLRARRAREASDFMRRHNNKTMQVLLERFQESEVPSATSDGTADVD